MCGIAGILNWKNNPRSFLPPMLDVITHRGPDDEGIYANNVLAMGIRRLSIIDLEGGKQPITNHDGSITVVFNGEIYNYIELRTELIQKGYVFKTQSDTEVLVHLYEEYDVNFLNKLNGMFGFSIWDARKQRLFIVRDRLGVKPMYYSKTSNSLIYGSEMKSLLTHPEISRELNPNALFDYLIYQYIPGELTPFIDIHKLLPGHYLLADQNGIQIKLWWNVPTIPKDPPLSYPEAKEKVRELFFDSVRLRMRSDVPVGAFLSGGLDSSLVTSVASQQTQLPFSTFSIGFSNSEFDELPYAKKVAEREHTNHFEKILTVDDAFNLLPKLIWHMDEPMGDSAIIPTYLVSKFAVNKVKVALTGIGGDELFGGYSRYHSVHGKFENLLSITPLPLIQLFRPILGAWKDQWGRKMDRYLNGLKPWEDYVDKIRIFDPKTSLNMIPAANTDYGYAIQKFFQEFRGDDYVNQRMYVDLHTYLPDQILAVTDRMSMAASLEARVPFLDYRLVELAFQLKGSWKVKGEHWKLILKDCMKDLVPTEILNRPKWGFASPVKQWLQGKRKDQFATICHNSHLAKSGIIDTKILKSLCSNPNSILWEPKHLWLFVMLELWYRIFCENTSKNLTLEEITETMHSHNR